MTQSTTPTHRRIFGAKSLAKTARYARAETIAKAFLEGEGSRRWILPNEFVSHLKWRGEIDSVTATDIINYLCETGVAEYSANDGIRLATN